MIIHHTFKTVHSPGSDRVSPSQACAELFSCVRTTHPTRAYLYKTVKSKIEPQQASILVLVRWWHVQQHTTRLAAHSLIMNGPPLAQSCSSENTSMSCASPLLLRTPHIEDDAEATCVFVPEKQSPDDNCIPVFWWMHIVNTHGHKETKTNQELWSEINQLLHTLAWWHKSQCFYKSSDGLKEDPVGYYGMSGICWGSIGLPVWTRRAWSVWIALLHFLPFPSTSVKRFVTGERKRNPGEQEMSVSRYSGETGCVCVLLREGQCLVQSSINPALRQSARGFNRGKTGPQSDCCTN